MRDLAFIYENALGIDADEEKSQILAQQGRFMNKCQSKSFDVMPVE